MPAGARTLSGPQAVLLFDARDDMHALRSLDSVVCGRRAGPSVDKKRGRRARLCDVHVGHDGRPKGVMIRRHSILRLVLNTNQMTSARTRSADRPAQLRCLDIRGLGRAARRRDLVIADRDELIDPRELERMIRDCRITTMWLTTGLFTRSQPTTSRSLPRSTPSCAEAKECWAIISPVSAELTLASRC